MSVSNLAEKWDMRFLLRAMTAWLLSATFILTVASFVVSRADVSANAIGYISSFISFTTALFAGAAAVRYRMAGGIYMGVLTATAITTVLLTIGFLVAGTGLEASGVLSVATFTFSGSLVGCVFFSRKKRNTKSRFAPKQRR